MPNTHTTLTSLFEDIADEIRTKTGGSSDIVADDFPSAIAAIPTGGGYSTLTAIDGTTGNKMSTQSGGSYVLNADYSHSLVSGAKLYCMIYSDAYTTSPPSMYYIVFTPDGTVVGRSANAISVSISGDTFTVSISRSAGSGTRYYYTFRGFALS